MNYTDFHREELRDKFLFRIFSLLISITVILLILVWGDSGNATLNVVSGLFVSLAAWGVVAVVDFVMEFKSQYVEERTDFIKNLNVILSKENALNRKYFGHLTSKPKDYYQALGKTESTNFWIELYSIVKELQKNNWRASLEKRVYANSEEFEGFCNYINRCQVLLCAYLKACSRNNEFPVDKFFLLYSEPANLEECLKSLVKQHDVIKGYWQQMKCIELNDEPLSTSEEIWCKFDNSIVAELNEFGNGISRHDYVKSSLRQRADKLLNTSPNDNACVILWKILLKMM